jgi:hypothetical protein
MLVATVLQSAFSSQMLLNRLNLVWFRRKTAYLMLTCYGVIALWGQGLHEFLDDDGCDQVEQSVPAVVAPAQGGALAKLAEPSLTVRSPTGGHVHDCDNCPICQFQALSQHFVAPPCAEIGMAVCDYLSPGQAESVDCPALYSLAQPRAPPVA